MASVPSPDTGAQPGQRAELQSAAQQLGIDMADAQAALLLGYLEMLQRWNRVYNLTAVRNPADMLRQHLIDCLALLPPLRRWWAATAKPDEPPPQLLDVGSGGGLPGVVVAAMQPGWRVDCVDTVAKKASFIRQVAAELRMDGLRGLHARVEALAPPAGGYRVITSRAFASLADFTRLTGQLLATDGVWLAMKGKRPDDELAALPAEVQVFHVEQLLVPGLDAQRCLVWMRPRAAGD